MKSQPSTLVFDIGGVLIDWNPRYLYRNYFEDSSKMEMFLSDVCSPEWNTKQDGGRSFAEATSELIEQHPGKAELIEAFDKRWEETIGGAIEPTVKLFERLHKSGHDLYGLSNWSAEKFQITKRNYAFLDYFKEIVVSGEVGLVKPDPKIYELLLRIIHKRAEDCLFIDDSLDNIKTAKILGFHTFHFENADTFEQSLVSYGFLS